MTDIPLAAGPEFDRIRAIARALGPHAQGLGDDCAVLRLSGPLVASTDLSVEEVHFRRAWLAPAEMGWRAAAAALSDLAAAGARAVGVLAAIGAPAGTPADTLAEVMRGIGDAASSVGAAVVGGDLSRAERWTLAVTVLGTARRPASRAGARPGDRLWVTGQLGAARAALLAWKAGREPEPGARAAFAHPVPRLALGQLLVEAGATAMLDLSDGLAGDARHLAAASSVALDLHLERVPLAGAVAEAAAAAGELGPVFAAVGGEDYELLVALPPEFDGGRAAELARESGIPLTEIGRAREGSGVQLLLGDVPQRLPSFDHFA